MNWFYMLQISPVVLAEIWAIRYYRRMREADTRTTRSADLQPRRLFDFVSPVLVGLAGFVYVAFCVLIVYIEQFDFPWFGGYLNIVVISATNLLIAGTIIWKLRGKKSDPYQTRGDRRSEIGLLINQMVLASIAVTTYAAISVILSSLDLRHYKAAAGCLYLIVLSANCFRKLRIDNLNFDVYRGDAGDPPGVSESEGEVEPTSHRMKLIGLSLGFLFGAVVGAELGESLLSLVGGAGVGAALGMFTGSRLDARRVSTLLVQCGPGI